MAIQISKDRITVYEYERMIEEGILSEDERVELIEGEIIEMSPIGKRHAACVNRLVAHFGRDVGQSAVLSVQNPVQMPDYAQPQPDVALLRPREDFYAEVLPLPTDILLIVEVSETSAQRDRNMKVPLYAKAGIPEIWLVDLKNEVVEVYMLPSEGKYQEAREARRGEMIGVRSVPGLTLGVNDIPG